MGVSKLFQINLAFLGVGLVISVSIDIFLVFLFLCLLVVFFLLFCNIIFKGLNVSEFNLMYEILE